MSGFHVDEHDGQEFNLAFIIAIIANSLFVVFQIVFSLITNSTSLFADAIHNLGDVLSLVLAWLANNMLKKIPTAKTTYGLKKTTILASFANAVLLIFSSGIIATEAIYKFFNPSEVHALGVIIVASIGIAVNGVTAVLFFHGTDDLNVKAAFLHLVYDALVSVGVVITAILLYITGWQWLDPLVGMLIAVIIIKGSWSLLKDSFMLLSDGVPKSVSVPKIREYLKAIAGVVDVHDLHVWALSTKENALSAHLVMPKANLSDAKRQEIEKYLHKSYKINHVTLQVEENESRCAESCQII